MEQRFINEHPEYQGRVTESRYAVKCIKGFRVREDNVPVVLTKYEEVEEPLVFVTVDLNGTKTRFVKKGNGHQYEEMLQYRDDNPEYKDNFFDSSLEQGTEEAKKKEEEAKKQQEIESKLEAIGETVQLPKMNAVEPEEVPKQHPKKQQYPRKYYPTIAADPPVTPMTE